MTKATIRDPLEAILELTDLMNNTENDPTQDTADIASILSSFIKNRESVLQELDIQRLRAIIYRDVVRPDRSKTGKNVVVVAVNLSLLLFFFTFIRSALRLVFVHCLIDVHTENKTLELTFRCIMLVSRTMRNNRNSSPWPSSTLHRS